MTARARRPRSHPLPRPERSAIRLIGYARASPEDAARNGPSLISQRQRIRAYARAQQWDLLRIESDAAVSGHAPPGERPALARALDAVRSGAAGGIAVVALDRLSRNAIETLLLIERSKQEGWRLVAFDQALDTGTATGALVAEVMVEVAGMYRDQIRERTRSALDQVAREGRARSRLTPYGWRTGRGRTRVERGDRGKLRPHAEEQKTLQRMLRLRSEGTGPQSIAEQLNAAGRRRREGRPWTRQTVWRTLERCAQRPKRTR